MNIPFFTTQVDFLYRISAMRGEWLDPIFLFLNYFDSVYFLLVLIPFVWIGISPRWGLRIAILTIFCTLLNYNIKLLFHQPRPIVDFPDLAMLPFLDPGFPSGGAQMAALLGGLLIYSWKHKWTWVIGISYPLLIGFSRLYLGVHYPTDVLGGYAIGLLILFVFIFTINPIEKICKKQGRGFCVILSVLICFLYSYLLPSAAGYRLMGAFLGFCLGAYVALIFDLAPTRPRSDRNRILSSIATIFIVYVLFFLTSKSTPPPLQAFIIALWISAGAFPACRAFLPK